MSEKCPTCGRSRSKSMGCPDTCVSTRPRSTRGPIEMRRLMENLPAIFTDDQVASLNAYQVAGVMHPFTCGHRDHSTELVAYPEGWRCPITGTVEQDWFHSWMGDWSWVKMDVLGREWDKENGKWK